MKHIILGLGLLASSSVSADVNFGETLKPIFAEHPEITEIEVCLEDVCETYFRERRGGSADLMYQRPKGSDDANIAGAVGEIVGSVGSKVGAGGRVVVDYHKKPNGEVKIHVEASFGVGAAAEAAAGAGTEKSEK